MVVDDSGLRPLDESGGVQVLLFMVMVVAVQSLCSFIVVSCCQLLLATDSCGLFYLILASQGYSPVFFSAISIGTGHVLCCSYKKNHLK
jgi:hypothetical protein